MTDQTPEGARRDTDCPIHDSRHWHAWIDQVDPAVGTGRLNISGKVELPSPGYTLIFDPGPLDRRRPPALRIKLIANPPQNGSIQVITNENVRFSNETKVLHYRSIFLICGDQQLTEFVDVVPTE